MTLESLGASVAKHLLESDLDLNNTILLGWSYGGVLGYEVCKRLSANTRQRNNPLKQPELVMLDSGFSDGLHEVTFERNFQEVMFACELGLLPTAIPEYASHPDLDRRLKWLCEYLKEQKVVLTQQDLSAWWLLYKARLNDLLTYSLGTKAPNNRVHLIIAEQHPHGREDLGWMDIGDKFIKRTINTDHQGIVRNQMTVDWLQQLIKQGA